MANSKIYLGSTNIGSLFQGADDISIYLGDEKVYPLEIPVKWLATYTGGTTSSAECDASSAITQNEITLTDLVSVEIGSCLTSIGENTFDGCTSLTSCTIGSGVTSIGSGAFFYCRSLTSIVIPSGVTSIGEYAFYDCRCLTSITVEATTVPTLGLNAFTDTNNCPIYVPCDSVDAYKSAWSTYASRITCIEPPLYGKYRARYSDGRSFELNCSSVDNNWVLSADTHQSGYELSALTSVTIGGCVTKIGLSAFTNATNLEVLNLNEGLQTMDFASFQGCSKLKSVTFPSTFTAIATTTFSGCTGLEKITFLSETPIRIYYDTFDGSTCPIYVPASAVEDYKAATGWSRYANRVTAIPNS